MPNLEKSLNDLQVHMGRSGSIQLIRAWTNREILVVEKAIREAVMASGVIGSTIPYFHGTLPAKGNQATNHFVSQITPFLPKPNTIHKPKGIGYPDRVFLSGKNGYFMSTKATTKWHDLDALRRVLTCDPYKMEKLVHSGKFTNPPAHMICTVLYSDSKKTTTKIRLDFLEPQSEVNVRFEISTSQRQLFEGTHHSVEIK